MPSIGPRRDGLQIPDDDRTWRIVLRDDVDAIVIVGFFNKKTRTMPRQVIENQAVAGGELRSPGPQQSVVRAGVPLIQHQYVTRTEVKGVD
jgi:hypothetical protein